MRGVKMSWEKIDESTYQYDEDVIDLGERELLAVRYREDKLAMQEALHEVL